MIHTDFTGINVLHAKHVLRLHGRPDQLFLSKNHVPFHLECPQSARKNQRFFSAPYDVVENFKNF